MVPIDSETSESFAVEFDDWAKQEMMTHGQEVSFKEWAEEEGEKHGDMDLTDWAKEEEKSHDERYGAENDLSQCIRIWVGLGFIIPAVC